MEPKIRVKMKRDKDDHTDLTVTWFCNLHRLWTCCQDKNWLRSLDWCALMDVRRKLGSLFCLQGELNKHSVHWAAASCVGLRQISVRLLWEVKNRKMDFVNAMGFCCLCNFIGMLQ